MRLRRRRRLLTIAGIVVGIVVFVVISGLLARALSVGGAENSALTGLVGDEARGNTQAVISDISGCDLRGSCRARAAANVAALRQPGAIQIAQIQPSAGFSLSSTTGVARVAWVAGNSLPRVQCVRVRRGGDVLSGYRIQLLVVSLRIRSGADCPARF
jgi:hypothetical protein